MSGLEEQLKTLVRSARKKDQLGRFLGVRSEASEPLPEVLDVGPERWHVRRVRSPLEARMALVDAGSEGRALLVTPLASEDLGLEVMARLISRKLQDVHPWQLVREQFQARRLDPRVVKQAWIARELLESAGGYPPAPSGLLDLDTVWAALFPRLGLAGARPGIGELLAASAAGGLGARWSSVRDEFRAAARGRLRDTAGSAGDQAVAAIEAGHGDDLVPLGLVLDLLRAEDVAGEPRALVVRTRMERFGLHADEPAALGSWADEAVRWVRTGLEQGEEGRQRVHGILERAEALVTELKARELVGASGVLRSALEARSARLAEALLAAGEGAFDRASAERAYQRLRSHLLVDLEPSQADRALRAQDALRLARWLGSEPSRPYSLAEHAQRYRAEGAYVDRARSRVARGEGHAELAAVYARLVERAEARREDENRAFAERLARVHAEAEGAGEVLAIEDALTSVVAPLAEQRPVLLVVMDGMSEAIAEELVEDVQRLSSFQRMSPDDQERLPPMLGLLPSVTEVCRTSLLCGARRTGGQAEELEGFEGLAARHGWRGRATKQRILFHKAELTGKTRALASEVQAAIESGVKVVAVVVNAVDDQLGAGEQLRPDWKLESVPVLQELVHQAELAGRALVLTADHGHVVDAGSTRKVGNDGREGRWRRPGTACVEEEIEVRGPRVLLPQPGGPCVVPWSERLRYSNPHAGYHGGASPQEVVTPLVVLVPGAHSAELPGWRAEVHVRPWWWDGTDEVQRPEPVAPRPAPVPARKKVRAPEPTPSLFAESVPSPAVAKEPQRPAWLEQLFASDTWAAQRKLAGRTPPPEEDVAEVLAALAQAGGKLSLEALRNRTRFTERQLRGLLTAMGRILNVDGYAVLEVDYGDGEAQVSQKLLFTQFTIEGEGSR